MRRRRDVSIIVISTGDINIFCAFCVACRPRATTRRGRWRGKRKGSVLWIMARFYVRRIRFAVCRLASARRAARSFCLCITRWTTRRLYLRVVLRCTATTTTATGAGARMPVHMRIRAHAMLHAARFGLSRARATCGGYTVFCVLHSLLTISSCCTCTRPRFAVHCWFSRSARATPPLLTLRCRTMLLHAPARAL